MIKNYIICVLCSLLMACQTMPVDTINKKLAVFEVVYKQALEDVGLLIKNGTLTGDQKTSVQNIIRKLSNARAAIYVAKGMADMAAAENHLAVAQSAMQLLTEIIQQKQKQSFNDIGDHYDQCTNCA